MIVKQLTKVQLPLASKFYQQHNKSMKPRRDDLVWALYVKDEIVGCVRQRRITQYPLLTGLLIAPKFRGAHLGKLLIDAQLGPQPIWLFCAAQLVNYYQACGFVIDDQPPAELAHKLHTLGKDLICMHRASS